MTKKFGYQALDDIGGYVVKIDTPLEIRYQKIAENIVNTEVLDVQRVVLQGINNDGTYENIAGVAKKGPEHKFGERYKIADCPPIVKMLKKGKTFIIENPSTSKDTQYLKGLIETLRSQGHELKSIMWVPVFLNYEVAFTIVIDALGEKDRFTETDKIL